MITVADGSKLDYESASSHNIVARVTDSERASTDKAINIDLADINEAPIELQLKSEAVVEDAANGTVVGSAAATDQDANETFTYSLTDDAGGRFAINAETGDITVADTSKIDYESNTSHSVTVQVTDSAGNTRTEAVSFEIKNAVGDDIRGTGSDDRLYGTSEEEALYGGAGNDTIIAGAGDELLEGGDGNDYLRGDAGNDTLDGGDGNDSLLGGAGEDVIDAGSGNDSVYGGAGDDRIDGGAGNDNLRGEDGDDTVFGGTGNDYLDGGAGDDLFILAQAQGKDRVSGGSGDWTDMIELQDGSEVMGEYGTDWTVSIESGEIRNSGTDGDSSWLELTDDSSGIITMQDGTEITFDGIEHISW